MYYIIYDNEYPMAAFMSYDDVIGMAQDILGPDKDVADIGINPLSIPAAIAVKPENSRQMMKAAKSVLEDHWGLFEYYPYDEPGEFIWYATEHNLLDQATGLIKLHDPEFARIELGN